MVKFLKRHAYESRRREKRQSAACIADYLALDTDKLERCSSVFEEAEDDDYISDSNIDSYCNEDCGSFLVTTFTKLAKDCEGQVTPLTQQQKDILGASCYTDPRSQYCLHDWIHPEEIDDSDYESCYNYKGSSCTDECSRSVSKIIKTDGCCYSYFLEINEDAPVFSNSKFTACKRSPPKHCT